MSRDVINRVAFAIQDESMTRLEALRYARAALNALKVGDCFNGMAIHSRSAKTDIRRPFMPSVPEERPGV